MIEAEGIHKNVTDHIGLRLLGLFAGGDACGADTGGEEVVGQGIDDEAVDLLGHLDIERACACHEMGEADAPFLRDDSGGHRRGEVIDNDHHIDGMLIKELVELRHHLTGDLIEARADDTEIILRTGDLEIVEEGGLERGIVGTAGIDEQTAGFGALADGPH